ncbi:DUF2442 domain-containing protein [bacterium]|nr:DUF2442 domain-containing protein [bacterium]
MKKYHEISNIQFEGTFILMTVDGAEYQIDVREHSSKLAAKDERTKMNFTISPSGYGLHWPEIDEDLSIDAMIKSIKAESSSIRKSANSQ